MPIQKGDAVAIHYAGSLDSGEEFDSSADAGPLQFTVGADEVLPGFEAAILGLEVGSRKKFRLAPEEAYGPWREDLVMNFERELFEGDEIHVGQTVDLEDEEGESFPGEVVEFDDESVTVDLNHPLAGEGLNFEIEVVSVGGQ